MSYGGRRTSEFPCTNPSKSLKTNRHSASTGPRLLENVTCKFARGSTTYVINSTCEIAMILQATEITLRHYYAVYSVHTYTCNLMTLPSMYTNQLCVLPPHPMNLRTLALVTSCDLTLTHNLDYVCNRREYPTRRKTFTGDDIYLDVKGEAAQLIYRVIL